MGSTKLWLFLIAAQIIILVALAALGPMTAATPALRYTGWACLAGIFACIPPLLIKLFVAGQVKIGNGELSMVRAVQQHEVGITIGVWAIIAVALAMALPRIKSDIAADNLANATDSTLAVNSSLKTAADSAAEAAVDVPASTPRTSSGSAEATSSVDTTPIAVANDTSSVLTPAAGSKTRTAIFDALRDRLKTKGRFRVDHIRTYKSWAFVRATEVVELDKGELQETDLTVSALLELSPNSTIASWRIVELWTLPDEQQHPMADFLRGVRAKQRAERLPAALFPDDLR